MHIDPDETAALARIPAELPFPAPRLPAGHLVLGYDEKGHCPMFVVSRCSIHQHRPRTCRTYDCRLFAATAVAITDKPAIAAQVARWRFSLPAPEDRDRYDAVRAAGQVDVGGRR